MTLFGEHGAGAVAEIFFLASLPYTLLLAFFQNRMHPDTYLLIVTLSVLLYVGACIFWIIHDVQHHQWATIPLWIVLIVLNLHFLYRVWKRRKGKKKLLAALGAKSKALRDKLVGRMREAQPESSG